MLAGKRPSSFHETSSLFKKKIISVLNIAKVQILPLIENFFLMRYPGTYFSTLWRKFSRVRTRFSLASRKSSRAMKSVQSV